MVDCLSVCLPACDINDDTVLGHCGLRSANSCVLRQRGWFAAE